MSNLWERFENIVSKDEVADVKAQFEPIEEGDYKVILENIEPSESKAGLPMLKGKFRMIDNNRIVFYNQMLQNLNNPNMTAVNVNEANNFINALTGEDIEFDTLGKLAERVTNISMGGVYTITVSYGKKDFDKKFPKIKIVGREAEELENIYN